MTFNSSTYFFFLPVVYLLFYLTADHWRWLVLLIASYVFYASFRAPYLLAVLFMVTGIGYVCGLRIASCHDDSIRKRWLWIGSCACVAILAIFKYLPLFESQVNNIFDLKGTFSTAIISMGVSYFTFQAISYLIDIYLKIEEPEHHFGRFALYMAFFPKLLQGPIERAGNLLPQLKYGYQFNYDAMRSGMLLFTWGLFKKVVVADRLSLYVDPVYGNVHAFTGLPLLLATYAYAFQIYMDFSGYTDMALGSAQLFNINLTQNFNSPYLATSVADFWRRWHISFSRWILDYIFKPLQMTWRYWKNWGTANALAVTFLVSGIWHGASWGFVIWGGLHGVYMACSVFYRPYQKKLHKALGIDKTIFLKVWQVFVTFNMVCFAWIFFRAETLSDAYYVVKHMFNGTFDVTKFLSLSNSNNLSAIIIGTVILITVSYIPSRLSIMIQSRSIIRWTLYYALLYTILCLGKDDGTYFIYTKF